MDMTIKMVAKFSNYLWLDLILYTGKWHIFWELWKVVLSRTTESKTRRSTGEWPNRESSGLGTKMLWSEKGTFHPELQTRRHKPRCLELSLLTLVTEMLFLGCRLLCTVGTVPWHFVPSNLLGTWVVLHFTNSGGRSWRRQ